MLTAALIVRPARRRSWLKASRPDHSVGRRNSRPPGKTDFIMNLSLAWVDQVQAIPSRRRSPALSIRSGQHRRGKLHSPIVREYDSSLEHCGESDVPGTGAGAAPLLSYFGPGGAAEAETLQTWPGSAGGLPAGRAGQVALRSAGTSAASCWARRPAPASLSATRSSQDPAASEVTTESITRLTKNVSLMIPTA
jgi:hypothetical protein